MTTDKEARAEDSEPDCKSIWENKQKKKIVLITFYDSSSIMDMKCDCFCCTLSTNTAAASTAHSCFDLCFL